MDIEKLELLRDTNSLAKRLKLAETELYCQRKMVEYLFSVVDEKTREKAKQLGLEAGVYYKYDYGEEVLRQIEEYNQLVGEKHR